MTRTWIPETTISGRSPLEQPPFLPMSRQEMQSLGWKEIDILLVSGDAYIDHPSFAVALLGRWLIAHGYKVGVVTQPRWNTTEDIMCMGRPTLYAGVSAGAIDSMLAHYTAFRKKRHDDAYTPGGKAGARPNRAILVYTNLVRQAFAGLPVVIGGIEASLRRITHYDFWTDALRNPILPDSKADALVYGMGERAMLAIANRIDEQGSDSGIPLRHLVKDVMGIATLGSPDEIPAQAEVITLPSHEKIVADSTKLMEATLQLERHVHHATAWAVQPVGKRFVLQTPPAEPLSEAEMDTLYGLPFAKKAHPAYTKPIPCEGMMQTSITTHRGCGGGCSFCSLALHQGRRIASRSRESIQNEVHRLTQIPHCGKSLSDVGGPSANMWQAQCTADPSKCNRTSCMHPKICPKFKVNQSDAIRLLRSLQKQKGITHVRVASGVRYDLAQQDKNAMRAYTMEFTGGQLKVAPEHICDGVLDLMRKPTLPIFEKFLAAFGEYSRKANKEQYVIPYLMSAFPGCTDDDMRSLGDWLHKRGWKPQQVQCFIPTPGTVATAMFYAGIDPKGNAIPIARTDADRLRQHHILMPDVGRKPQRNNKKNAGRKNDRDERQQPSGKSNTRYKKSHTEKQGKSGDGKSKRRQPRGEQSRNMRKR